MSKVLILYGWHASPSPHWQDWLARELVSRGHLVSFPQLSNPMEPKKEIWLQEAKIALDELKPDIVICHSLGNVLWWHLCNEGLALHVKRLLLVAPPRDLREYKEISNFFPVELPVSLYAKESLLVTSDDDPYLNKSEGIRFARALNIKHKVFQNMGHINADSGFGPWPWVLEWSEALKNEDE
ncbi:MAG: alpha/beta hydrolase [Campylobacterota bacterium]|nr:alpha/beta hydrolase [Campylobacterota bacterium]